MHKRPTPRDACPVPTEAFSQIGTRQAARLLPRVMDWVNAALIVASLATAAWLHFFG